MANNFLLQFGVIPEGKEQYVIQNTKIAVEFAANKYQRLLLSGLRQNQTKICVLNSMFVNSFPRGFRKWYIPSFSKEVNVATTNYSFINTDFLNIWGIRHFSKYLSTKNETKKWCTKLSGKDNNVFIGYSAFGEAIDLCQYIKKHDWPVKTCIILPDLPECCYGSSRLYNAYLKHMNKNLKDCIGKIDRFVLFSKYMAGKLSIPQEKYIVVEGICEAGAAVEEDTRREKNTQKTVLLYTGALEAKYGLEDLLRAFAKIKNSNCELHLCGSGSAETLIKCACGSDQRIRFWGKVPNQEATSMQHQADILINPRQNNEEYTRYSFPSKTMEYLLSGTPMVGYKLDGIPDEYDPYIQYVEGPYPDDLAKAIEGLLAMHAEQRRALGRQAQAFVIREKSERAQAERLINFLES